MKSMKTIDWHWLVKQLIVVQSMPNDFLPIHLPHPLQSLVFSLIFRIRPYSVFSMLFDAKTRIRSSHSDECELYNYIHFLINAIDLHRAHSVEHVVAEVFD